MRSGLAYAKLVGRIPINISNIMASKRQPTTGKSTGIGRSAITGRFMSVTAARAHKKTAIVEGQRKKNKS